MSHEPWQLNVERRRRHRRRRRRHRRRGRGRGRRCRHQLQSKRTQVDCFLSIRSKTFL